MKECNICGSKGRTHHRWTGGRWIGLTLCPSCNRTEGWNIRLPGKRGHIVVFLAERINEELGIEATKTLVKITKPIYGRHKIHDTVYVK